MSSYTAPVMDGQIVQQTAKTETKKSTGENSLDKDAFLQLLVAEMKYQDPLEASNNSTEYISQLATFSELEGMQNLQTTAEDMKASDMIGKSVILNVDDNLITGQVDFLQFEDGKTKISVNGNYYNMEDVYQVIDNGYLSAYTKAKDLVAAVKDLPEVDYITEKDLAAVKEIKDVYESMSQYEVSFVAEQVCTSIEGYIAKYDQMTTTKEPERTPEEQIADKLDTYNARLEELLVQIVDNGKEDKKQEAESDESTEGEQE